MKIAHVVDGMEVGGAETLVAQMCRLAREQGHEARVYALDALGPLGEQLRREGFGVEAGVARSQWGAWRVFYRTMKAWRPDVVHLHNPRPTAYAGPAARQAGVRCIVSTRHNLAAAPRRMSVELRYALAARFCDWVVGVCDATVENLRGMHMIPARKIVRVYNGAAGLERVAQASLSRTAGFTLVSVGRLEPVKNHALLLQAFGAALGGAPDLRLWLVGDGSRRAMLERLADELGIGGRVTFWGQTLDVAPYLSAADGFVMASHSEGLPIALLEAFSLGLPAIVTDVGGMAEAVRRAEAGMVTPAGDRAALAAAMVQLAGREDLRAGWSRNALRAFAADFRQESMMDAYMRLYVEPRR